MSITQQQSIQAQIDHANEKISSIEKRLQAEEQVLSDLLGHRDKYNLLFEVHTTLQNISKTGAAELFVNATGNDPLRQSQQIHEFASEFFKRISLLEEFITAQKASIKQEQETVRALQLQLDQLRRQERIRKRKEEAELSRQSRQSRREIPYRFQVTAMPWSIQGEDDRRFRRILLIVLSIAIVFGGVIPIVKPPVENEMGIVVPERIARIIRKKKEAKQEEAKRKEKLAEQKLAEKVEEKPKEATPEKPVEKPAEEAPPAEPQKPTLAEVQKARSTVEKKGVLAFKNNLVGLMDDTSDLKIGAEARISSKADRSGISGGESQHSVIVSHATGGGSSNFTISRPVELNASQRIAGEGVKFTHVESTLGKGDQPISQAGPSRTDEEIQIVFDRHKSALYRYYNIELRSNPTLRGNMVLRIVIEPDGKVSSCTIKSTDIQSATLIDSIIKRVLKFNFGEKEGVPTITILYPIDFLPSS